MVIKMKRNIFIEGIQGMGKSTLSNRLAQNLKEYQVYHEGDISPVELAWCSYMTKEQLDEKIEKYPDFAEEIKSKTKQEGEYYITAYTRILAEQRSFYEDMEAHEIYNGRVSYEFFYDVIMKRYQKFAEEGCIFECSFFQNSIETMMLYYLMAEDEIISFYKEAYELLKDKGFLMLYLDSEHVRENILQIKKERSDEHGNEMWYPLMMQYLKESPYGKKHSFEGLDDLIAHLERRRKLEKRIIDEVLKDSCIVLPAREYDLEQVLECIKKEV